MMEGALYQPRKTSPTALAIVVLMHGAGITALALAKTDVVKIWDPPIVVDTIPEEKTPPEEPPKPIEKAAVPPESVVTHVPPVIDIPTREVFTELKPLPPVQPPYIPPPVEIVVAPKVDPPTPEVRTVKPARAKANLASYVSDEDYPNEAIRREEQGTTRFRLAVGANGQVTACTVIGSSGSSALDSATCRLMKQRAKFTPARDNMGQATTDSVSTSIRWVLPE